MSSKLITPSYNGWKQARAKLQISLSPPLKQQRPVFQNITMNRPQTPQCLMQKTQLKPTISKNTFKDFQLTRIFNELELIYKEFQRCEEINRTQPWCVLYDSEKWRRKFKTLFDREKVIDFGCQLTLQPLTILNQDQIRTTLTEDYVGKAILGSGKFWMLLCMFCKQEKLVTSVKLETDVELLENFQPDPVQFFIQQPSAAVFLQNPFCSPLQNKLEITEVSVDCTQTAMFHDHTIEDQNDENVVQQCQNKLEGSPMSKQQSPEQQEINADDQAAMQNRLFSPLKKYYDPDMRMIMVDEDYDMQIRMALDMTIIENEDDQSQAKSKCSPSPIRHSGSQSEQHEFQLQPFNIIQDVSQQEQISRDDSHSLVVCQVEEKNLSEQEELDHQPNQTVLFEETEILGQKKEEVQEQQPFQVVEYIQTEIELDVKSNQEVFAESCEEIQSTPLVDDENNVVLGKRSRETKLEEVFQLPKMQLRKIQRTNYASLLNPSLVCEKVKQPQALNFESSGASYVRYCVLEKQGQKVLVPVRYSIRNRRVQEGLNTSLTNECFTTSAEYKPSEMENLFSMSQQSQQTAMLLRSKLAPQVQPEDIQKVVQKFTEFAIVSLTQEARAKFSGAEQVAVCLQKFQGLSSERQTKLVRDLLRRVKEDARSKGQQVPLLMFAEGARQAKVLIKKI